MSKHKYTMHFAKLNKPIMDACTGAPQYVLECEEHEALAQADRLSRMYGCSVVAVTTASGTAQAHRASRSAELDWVNGIMGR